MTGIDEAFSPWLCQLCGVTVNRGTEHECDAAGDRRLWRVLQRRFDDRGDYWSLVKLVHANSERGAVGSVSLTVQADCQAFCTQDLKRRTS